MTDFAKTTISSCKILRNEVHTDSDSVLTVFQDMRNKLNISRVFFVHANRNTIRGEHAHYKCNQWLICISGSVIVSLFDGQDYRQELLEKGSEILYIPCGLWTSQEYSQNSVLLVLADQLFDEDDYIRSFEDFKKIKMAE